MTLPLEGIRVLSQGLVWAGPFLTLILGDLGAEVIEVESIHHLNPTRTNYRNMPPAFVRGPRGALYANRNPEGNFWDRYAVFNYGKRNCKSVTLNLLDPKGRDSLPAFGRTERRVLGEQRRPTWWRSCG